MCSLAVGRPAAGVRAGRRKGGEEKKKPHLNVNMVSPARPALNIVGVSSASCLCALQTLVVVRKQRNPLNVSIHSPRGGLRASGRQLSLDGCCWHFPQPCPPVCFCVRACVRVSASPLPLYVLCECLHTFPSVFFFEHTPALC